MAIDPVCGMLVDEKSAASVDRFGRRYYFCSAQCLDRFRTDPRRYPAAEPLPTHPDAQCATTAIEAGGGPAAGLARPAATGLLAGLALLALYFGLLSLVSGWDYMLEQFGTYWPFIIALAVGFAVQVGLYAYMRQRMRAASGKVVAVTGTASGAAMVSCCTHYLVNLLPALGATGLISLVGQFQVELFWIGILANLAGVTYMGRHVAALAGTAGHTVRA